ncbi:unnamed protein product [Clavelina lepadiformis]|uniref:Uncharacterized protein n=1 Tax=Clavelina lepadiformis TaxID=159417 RepID=A0ABP0H0P1_CLALP
MEPARREMFILIAVWFVLILTWITILPTNDQNKMTQGLERPLVMKNPHGKGTSTAFPPERFKPQSICEKTDENIIKESCHYSSSNHQTCIKNCDKFRPYQKLQSLTWTKLKQ